MTTALLDVPAHINVAAHLPRVAEERPDARAVQEFRRRGVESVTFAELERRVAAAAGVLRAGGVRRGDRTCVFVRPGLGLVATTFALFRLGAVPVLIDPGMGRRRLLACVRHVRPRALVGIPLVHVLRRLFPRSFRTVEIDFATQAPGSALSAALAGRRACAADVPPVDTSADDVAAVLFTSGSTGPPKGVVYTHGNFEAQIRILREMYGFRPGEASVACFPLFALFDVSLGMTSVFPFMDFTRPATCEPAEIVRAFWESGATTTFGSPAVWRRVAPWCKANVVTLPGVKRVLIAGAPVPPALVAALRELLDDDADVHTPYGATESLPVATISGEEILALRGEIESGSGTCVGRPAPGIEVAIVGVDDSPIEHFSDDLRVAPGAVGEVCVRGPVVTREYELEPEHTRAAKVADGDGFWHRMGDLGRLDDEGRLWFLGRKAHRLETAAGRVEPVPLENVFNTHPGVKRTALVGVGPRGSERPVLVVEPEDRRVLRRPERLARLAEELLALGRRRRATAIVERVLFHPAFPVDARHNAKIHREELKGWAEGRA